MAEGRTITPSEIIKVMELSHPQGWNEAARVGIEAHKRILGEVRQGKIPKDLEKLDLGTPIFTEKRSCREIGRNLFLSARIDLVDEKTVIDLKPGKMRMRHALQTAICCDTEQKKTGAVWFYDSGEIYQIINGGKEIWGLLEKMAVKARRILDIQDIFKEEKPTGRRKLSLGQEAVEIRRSFDRETEIATSFLRSTLVKIN